jgi:DNA-binding transcriptional LysR family regulator
VGSRSDADSHATSDIGETVLLPRMVARLAQVAPRVNLRCMVVGPRHLEDALEAGEVDLAVGLFSRSGAANN